MMDKVLTALVSACIGFGVSYGIKGLQLDSRMSALEAGQVRIETVLYRLAAGK